MLQQILEFKGTWRTYQKRVLDCTKKYIEDEKVHIVAAPGSGKTTLGIELIRRFNKPTLVLAPSITIRQQWVARIREGFMHDPALADEYLSQNIKEPKLITVITYQALHSAMQRFKGQLEEVNEDIEDDEETTTVIEEVDYSQLDVIKTIRNYNIGVVCLDECHHLRNEWWKALEDFMKLSENIVTIALTATPPYDSTPALWERYMNLCGAIDEEISIPELVKEGSLCPHQDFVYFNNPTDQEKKIIDAFEKKVKETIEHFKNNSEFVQALKSHKGFLNHEEAGEIFLEKPQLLEAIIQYFEENRVLYDSYYKRLLGGAKLGKCTVESMEIILQSILYDDRESYGIDQVYIEQTEQYLKQQGLIQRKKVNLKSTDKIKRMLTTSKGKIESIKEIIKAEYSNMRQDLRLLLLTDYIRKEYVPFIGEEKKEMDHLGVISFFELIRREKLSGLRLGVLCGTVVIIPTEAVAALKAEPNMEKIFVEEIPMAKEYVRVTERGESGALTTAITNIYAKGEIHVLIGTKSLLGEGWDSPCINALIMASFVGSFMLSNQMRGRAIRIFKDNPTKTSNIWHLVCADESQDMCQDYELLQRKMEHFLGLHYSESSIESGIDRMDIVTPFFTKLNVKRMNHSMIKLANERDNLSKRWREAVSHIDVKGIAKQLVIQGKDKHLQLEFFNAIAFTILFIIYLFFMLRNQVVVTLLMSGQPIKAFILAALFIFLAKVTFSYLPRLLALRSPLKCLESVGKGIVKALHKKGQLSDEAIRVSVAKEDDLFFKVCIKGGTGKDKELFRQCMSQFYQVIDNQRYIMVQSKAKKKVKAYYAVPDMFSKNKEDSELFVSCLSRYLGKYSSVYTRNPEGRELLLRAKKYAFSNRNQKAIDRFM